MNEIKIFVERLAKIGITVELFGNYPWIYLDTVNGIKVTEKYFSDHGFTIAFRPIHIGQKLQFTNIGRIFKVIRECLEQEKKLQSM